MYSNLFFHYPSWRIINVQMTNNLIINNTCVSVYYPTARASTSSVATGIRMGYWLRMINNKTNQVYQ